MLKVSYKPLWRLLFEREMTKTELRLKAHLTTNVIANMNKGKNVSLDTLVKICETLECDLSDVIELVKTED